MLSTMQRRALRGACTSPNWVAEALSRTIASSSACCHGKVGANVPEGHKNSDLSPTACHIGLNRRRDLSLRQELCLFQPGSKATLRDIFKDKIAAVFGVPDMGKVCSETQVPTFIQNIKALEDEGVNKVVCIAVDEPETVAAWADKVGLSKTSIETWADSKGAWTRMLGLDLEPRGKPGPKSQRYAAILDNGILLKLLVEKELGKVEETSAETIIACIKKFNSLRQTDKMSNTYSTQWADKP